MAKRAFMQNMKNNSSLPGLKAPEAPAAAVVERKEEPEKKAQEKAEVKPAAEEKTAPAVAEKKAEVKTPETPKAPEVKETLKTPEAKTDGSRVEAAQVAAKITKKRGRPPKKEQRYSPEGKALKELSFPLEEDLQDYLDFMASMMKDGSKRTYVKSLIIKDYEEHKDAYDAFMKMRNKMEIS